MVANSQVTTYMMCSGSDFFYVRSKYGHVMGDDLDGTLDCGCDTAQYNSFRKYYRNHLNLEKRDGLGRLYIKESQRERDGSLHHLPDERLAFQ